MLTIRDLAKTYPNGVQAPQRRTADIPKAVRMAPTSARWRA